MPDFGSRLGQTVGSTGQGFLIGEELLPGVGGIIGAGAGFLSGLLSPSAQEQQQSAIDRYINAIEGMRSRALNRLFVSQSGMAANAAQDAKRRAIAGGRAGQAESFIRPATEGVYAQNASREDALNRSFDQIEAQARGQSPEIQPPISDYLTTVGNAMVQRKRFDTLTNTMKGMRGFSGGMDGASNVDLSTLKMPTGLFDFQPDENIPDTQRVLPYNDLGSISLFN